MHRQLILASLAIAAGIGPSRAQDVAGNTEPSFFEGFYAGLNGGFGDGDLSVYLSPVLTFDAEGGFAGVQAGYNFAADNLVFGVEADMQKSDITYTISGSGGGMAVDSFGTVRARVGADFGGVMPYVTGGIAVGHYSVDSAGTPIGDDWTLGWTAGVGIEAALLENVSLKAEYLYVDLGQVQLYSPPGPLLETDFQAFRAGFNIHF